MVDEIITEYARETDIIRNTNPMRHMIGHDLEKLREILRHHDPQLPDFDYDEDAHRKAALQRIISLTIEPSIMIRTSDQHKPYFTALSEIGTIAAKALIEDENDEDDILMSTQQREESIAYYEGTHGHSSEELIKRKARGDELPDTYEIQDWLGLLEYRAANTEKSEGE